MSYYLQNFEPNYFSNIPKECQLEDVPCCSFTAGTTLNPNETSRYNKQANRCNAEKESPYRAHQKKIRKQYSKLLALWAKNFYKNASLHSVTSAASNLDTYNRKEQQDSVHNNVLQRVPTDLDATVVPSSGEFGAELLAEAQKYTNVVAPCSIFGANALAQTAVLRYSNFLDSENGDVSSKARAESLELWMEKARIFNEAKSTDGIPGKKDNGGFELVTIGLDSIFSVMVELNQRDPELCSQALQSLLQLLQNLPAESLSREPKSVVERMHSLLKQLRIEVSLAVACGHPQYIYSTVETLLCDAKKNVPFNQLCSECNMLPKNFHTLALNIQRYVYRGCPPTKTDKISQWRALLSSGESLCDFELVFPSNQSSYSDYGHSESTTSNVSHGSVVSNGSFVFMLTNYGLLKVGSGLTETKCGEVLSSNEILKYIDGSVLLVCNESLYLRRKHSSRLWVLDVETLREIGEIMLPASLSSEGVLFSDGKSFFHANLDEQWNFITTPLDDSSFMPLSNPRLKQCHRLAEIDYGVFGDTSQLNELFGSIPNSLQGVAVDIQICSNVAFILTRQGKVFYSGRGSALDLQDATKDEWLELPLSEHIVGMTGQSGSCLIMRSGAGHIWALGNLGEFFDNQTGAHQQQRTPSKKPRKIRIPNKRKCVSVAATAGCMAMATDSGKCIFHGRHIITTTSNTLSALDSIGAVATVALGRTHAVFVTKNGMLYSCGLNNMNQCGRHETQSTAATTSRNNPGSTSPNIATSYEYSEDANLLQIRTTSNQSPNRSPLPTEDSQNEHSFVRRAGISAQIARRRESGDKLGANFGLQFPDTTGGAILSPSRVVLLRPTNDIKVATVSVGNYHTVVLSADHQVFTFGSNVNGQLGTGDTLRRPGAHRVNLPSNVQVVQAVAGANHCVLRTSAGQVITFGAYKNGQLGRRPADKHKQTTTEPTSIFPGPTNREWFAEPGFVQGFGQTHGRLASWVGAQSDRTIIQCQRQVISQADLANCQVTANQEYILVVPSNKRGCNNKNYVVIGRQPYIGVNHFKISSAGALVGRSVCLDPRYSALLWSFDAVRMRVFAHSLDSQDSISVKSKSYDKSKQISEPSFLKKHRKFFATTALLLPSESENRFSDVQIAVYMLSMMYNLNIGAVAGTFESSVSTDVQGGKRQSSFGANEANGNFCPNDCSTVNRFESYGGGWGYSAHCVEAIQFKTNSDIFFCGVGLFGGRGEYMGKLKLFRVIGGADVEEQCVELLAETDEVIYECAPRETTFLRLAKGVEVRANQWHVIWAQIQGPSSDCGAAGQATVRNPADNVEFNFRTSLLSNNGTDVDVGQIPEIYYRLEKSSNRSVGTSRQTSRSPADEFGPAETSEESPAANLTYPKCLLKIEPGVMSHLYRILDWAIQGTLMMANSKDINDTDANWKQERAAFIGIVALRIIRLYIRILYKDGEENDAEIDRDHMSRAIEPIVRIHQTLIELFSSADKKLFNSDDTCLLLVDECIDAYVSCASLFVPSPQILRVHLSNAVVQAENLGSYRCWFLFALLRVFSHLDNYILPILDDRNGEVNAVKGGLLAAKLAEEFAASQKAGQSTQETTVTSSQQIKFLFTLAFANVDSDNVECVLTARLKYAAQEVIVKITKALVDAGLNIDSGPVLLQTPNRFQKISSQMNWDVDGDAYDAIAFKIDSSTINLHGAGVFLNCTSRSQCEYELGLLVNKGDSVNESWTLIEQTSGTVSDQTLMGGVDQIGDGVYANNDNGPPPQVVMIRFGRPVTLKPGVCYAVRVMLNAGKSFYGEDGICSVRLQNNAHITFFPCSLSQNGTTILRGQIPSLLYSVDKSPVKSRRHSEPHRNGFWFDQRTSIGLQNEIQENVPNGDLETSPEQTQQLFVQILRLLAQKLSSKMMISGQIPPTDRNTCSRLVAYGNVFVELHPWMTFDLIAAFDEVLPLMANLATDDENEDQDKSLNNAITASDKKYGGVSQKDRTRIMTLSKPTVQSVVESAHPYKSGQIYSQKVSFNPSVQFLSIRFHDECQTAQSGDVLWIYASVTENAKGSTFYPIGKYSGDRGWPVDTVVLVPGNLVWFVLETSPLQDQDCMDATKMYGFRCTVDGIFTNLSASIQSSPTSEILGQEFTWFCANSCRQLVQLPNTSNISHLREFSAGEQRTRDLVRRHGALLKRGLNIGTPVLKEVLQKRLPGAKQCQESQFLKDFISSDLETSAGTLARAIVGRPFVDLANCVMEVIPNEGLYYVGQSLRIQILLKDQFDRPIYAISQNNNKLDVEIFISCGISGLEVMVENDEILASRKALKSLQMSEPFRSVYVNKARYMSITMMSAFADHSFEELRLAYQHDSAIRTTLKLEREQPISEDRDQNLGPSSLASSISFSGIWTPRRAGRYTMQCSIDGFNLKSLKHVNVSEAVYSSSLVYSSNLVGSASKSQEQKVTEIESTKNLTATPRHASGIAIPENQKQNMAVCESTADFRGIRVRTHPTLSANNQIGVISRGGAFEYTEILKNADGVWLKMASDARSLYCDHHRSYSTQAWCLQFNNHLQVQYLTLPVQNGPKLSVDHQIAPKLTPKQEKAQQSIPQTSNCLRCVFAAFVWHSPGKIQNLITAANHLKSQPEIRQSLQRAEFGHFSRSSANTNNLPGVVQKVVGLWNEISRSTLAVLEKQMILPSPLDRNYSAHKIGAGNDMEVKKPSEKNGQADELCELCDGRFQKPITTHMRVRHPGCGGPSFSHGYNSVGHYTTGWTGTCGDGGQGNAVWYLLCPNCRLNYLKKGTSKPPYMEDSKKPQIGLSAYDSTTSKPSVEAILKRNALFLLELRPAHDEVASALNNQQRRPKHTGEWKIDMYPSGSPLPVQSGIGVRHIPSDMGNLAAMDEDVMSSADEDEFVEYTTSADILKRSPYRHPTHLSDPGTAGYGMTYDSMNFDELAGMQDIGSLSASANLYKREAGFSQVCL
ncbi:PHR domain-containing protein [Ditylenchus destructor]|uniref:PHR domain-containing protein n=1 Tax=Ditylenchus destructor TaxID=166010 RepID=A0AAD4R490_9BILA|nr:PHR domain-containing protein [Ditylenchus destructor]